MYFHTAIQLTKTKKILSKNKIQHMFMIAINSIIAVVSEVGLSLKLFSLESVTESTVNQTYNKPENQKIALQRKK